MRAAAAVDGREAGEAEVDVAEETEPAPELSTAAVADGASSKALSSTSRSEEGISLSCTMVSSP